MKTKALNQGGGDHSAHNNVAMDRLAKQGLTRKRPAARDGHSSVLYRNKFYVFGGDRHHMPFNDLFVLDLAAELQSKKLLK